MGSIIWAEWCGDADFASIDAFGISAILASADRSRQYEVRPATIVPLLYHRVPSGEGERDIVNLNARPAVDLLAWLLAAKLARVPWYAGAEVLRSSWCHALFASNFLVRQRLVGDLKLVVGTRTDYLLYRTGPTERGILFTPQAGLDFSGGRFRDGDAYAGVSVTVGLRNWWSFDGDNDSGDVVLAARVWGIPFMH